MSLGLHLLDSKVGEGEKKERQGGGLHGDILPLSHMPGCSAEVRCCHPLVSSASHTQRPVSLQQEQFPSGSRGEKILFVSTRKDVKVSHSGLLNYF